MLLKSINPIYIYIVCEEELDKSVKCVSACLSYFKRYFFLISSAMLL